MAKVGSSSPWVIFYKEVAELFKQDPGVRVVYDEDKQELRLYVDGADKAGALTLLLPEKKSFGSMTLNVTIIPSNDINVPADNLYRAAFDGNGALSYIKTIRGIFTNDITYVVFKNVVVQYFNDDLGDVNGLCSTLYQNLAKNVLEPREGVFFCTDIPNDSGIGSYGKPVGVWPY